MVPIISGAHLAGTGLVAVAVVNPCTRTAPEARGDPALKRSIAASCSSALSQGRRVNCLARGDIRDKHPPQSPWPTCRQKNQILLVATLMALIPWSMVPTTKSHWSWGASTASGQSSEPPWPSRSSLSWMVSMGSASVPINGEDQSSLSNGE